MYHSLTINGINTFDNWHLVPANRPVVAMPPVREQILELPGSNGNLDLTDSLTGYPLYGDRTGSWEFIVLNQFNGVENYDWSELYSQIAYAIHGVKSVVVLEDDPDYFYIGRLKLDSWTTEENNSKITISYVLEPYKYEIEDIATKYEDVFKFYSIDSSNNFEIPINLSDYVDRMPVHPEIIINSDGSSPVTANFVNKELNMSRQFTELIPGVNPIPRFTITNFSGNNECKIYIIGKANVKINFRNGRL